MREILFRGKVSGSCRDEDLRGQWVEGNLVHQTDYYGSSVDRYHILYTGEFDYDHYDSVIVIPETVGQFTGLTDKNGKRIFEGDIIKLDNSLDVKQKNFEVKFIYGQFYIGINKPVAYVRYSCEIIGNIHDNPELLEEW